MCHVCHVYTQPGEPLDLAVARTTRGWASTPTGRSLFLDLGI